MFADAAPRALCRLERRRNNTSRRATLRHSSVIASRATINFRTVPFSLRDQLHGTRATKRGEPVRIPVHTTRRARLSHTRERPRVSASLARGHRSNNYSRDHIFPLTKPGARLLRFCVAEKCISPGHGESMGPPPPPPPTPSPCCPLDRERPGERSRGALSLSLSGESPAAPSSSLFTSSFSFPYSRPLPLPACSASSPSRPLLCKSARIALASTTRAFRCTLLRGPPVLLSLPSTSPSSLPPSRLPAAPRRL